MERLQKVIAQSGYCSRRKAETLITKGKVQVNGVTVTELGTKVSYDDTVMVNGEILQKEEFVYYVLYKPEGYVSTTDDEKGRRTVIELVPNEKRIYPIGRLDYDTSGVLLFTNDGAFANRMASPTHEVEKEYRVKVQGFLRKEESRKIALGIRIGNYKTKPCQVWDVTYNTKSETSVATVIIKEGKYHQVKRMFEAVNHPVLSLKRVRYGVVTLEGMKRGDVRRLKPYELKQLNQLGKS